MSRWNDRLPRIRDCGFSLIEVLVTIVILLIGLLGLAGLQSRAFTAQLESYQRSQALILVKDMADRIEANRSNAAAYTTSNPSVGGAGVDVTVTCPGTTTAQRDLCDWHNALMGSAEGSATTAMIGARGCVLQETPVSGVPETFQVIVSWQGLNSTASPSGLALECGQGKYKDRDGNIKEALHRALSIPVSVATLQAP